VTSIAEAWKNEALAPQPTEAALIERLAELEPARLEALDAALDTIDRRFC